MATITTLSGYRGNTQITRGGNVKVPYMVEVEIDYAEALVAKGSALAAADVIEAIYIPANTQVWSAGACIKVPGNSTTLTLTVGTGADADEWVATLDGKAAAGTYGADVDSAPTINTYATADTVDVTLATLTGTLSTGKVRVWAVLLDVSDSANTVGIAQIGS